MRPFDVGPHLPVSKAVVVYPNIGIVHNEEHEGTTNSFDIGNFSPL